MHDKFHCPIMWLRWTMTIVVAASMGIARAHDQVPGPPQAGPIAIIGGHVHPVDAADIKNGYVLFVEGKIKAIGDAASIDLPPDTTRIDATGKHVYPGLVAGLSDIGLREISSIAASVDSAELGSTNPNVRSWVAFNPDSELIPVARANGILTTMVAPIGERLQGQSAVLSMDGWAAADMLVLAPAGMCVAWQELESTERVDKTRFEAREKQLKELDKLLDQAKRYEQAKDHGKDLVLESLLPVIHGEIPLIIQANRKPEIESAVAYAMNRQLKVVIHGGFEAAECAEILIKHDVPVILPGTLRLPMHRHDPYDSPYTLPARLSKAGVKYCISGEKSGYPSGATNLRNLPYQAAKAVAHGLAPDEALRAITLSAAEIIGVGDRVGSLTVGKDATLMIVDGDILEMSSNVTQAWIQGRQVDLGNRHRTLFEKYEKKYNQHETP
jgi:imidazolonepropionase-like amidohydrolase